MAGRFTKGSLTFSMIVGTVLVPVSAFAALWLIEPDDTGAEESAATTTTSAPIVLDASPNTTVVGVTRADLQTACGPEGMQLVSLEEQGTISDVQQAALDALRDLCEQQGLALPAKPASEPIVKTVVVPAPSTVTTAPATTSATYDDDHDEYEDDDEYEHDDDDDEHNEDDDHHEDDDHGDDEHEDDD